ncbi:hypothetical protein JXA85_03500 [Candidatus Woesearchaeota archaeon]|nr:hypothetical protein [Candidatus Woesearchaeota archaeon]
MADIITDLKDIFEEFVKGGDADFKEERFNSAVTQYFKAIAVLCDLKLYEQRASLPSNHTERFTLLKTNFAKVYSLLSKIFRGYTDSYNIKLTKKDAENMRENVNQIKRLFEDKE